MITELRARVWQIGAFGAGAFAVALLVILAVQGVKLGEARKALPTLVQQLANSNRDLSQCRSNRAGLEPSLGRQNAALDAARRAGQEMRARSDKAVSEAQAGKTAAERRAAAILAKRPVGADACQRAMEADDLIMGTVK